MDMLLDEAVGEDRPPNVERAIIDHVEASTPSSGKPKDNRIPFPFFSRPLAIAASVAIAAIASVLIVAVFRGFEGSVPESEAPLAGTAIQADGSELAPGSSLQTDKNPIQIAYADGSQISIQEKSSLQLVASTDLPGQKRLRLNDGSIDAQVSKQPENRPLVIESDHAEITVIGTQFSVSTAPSKTHLHVDSGLVQFTVRQTGDTFDVGSGSFVSYSTQDGVERGESPTISGYTVLNADQNTPLNGLENIAGSATLSLSALETRNLNIRVESSGMRDDTYMEIEVTHTSSSGNVGQTRTRSEGGATGHHVFRDSDRKNREVWPRAWTPQRGIYKIRATPKYRMENRTKVRIGTPVEFTLIVER